MPKNRFIILDANALFHRAWHAVPALTTKKGELVNAVYGFTSVLLKIIQDLKPTHLAAAFDLAAPTFRHEIFKEYKAHREKQPQELYDQIPKIKKILKAFNIPIFEKERYEADDIIASICDRSSIDNSETESIIVTGDRDAFQLVDKNTNVLTFKKGVSETKLYDIQAIQERYGLKPELLIEVKALAGDASDNIAGVPGVGEKTALKLIQKFKSIQKLYKAIDQGKAEEQGLKKGLIQRLTEHREEAKKALELVRLVHNVPLDFDLKKTKFGEFDYQEIQKLFEEFEFKTLVSRVPQCDTNIRMHTNNTNVVSRSPRHNPGEFVFELRMGLFGPEEIIISGKKISTREAKKFFEDTSLLKIGHDIKTAMSALSKLNINLQAPYFDTMIAAYLLYPGRRTYQLKDLLTSNQTLWDLYEAQKKELQEKNLWQLFQNIELPLIPVLLGMEEKGIKVDQNVLAELGTSARHRLEKLEKDIYKLAGETFNINSPKVLKGILFEKLKLPTKSIARTKTGISTAAPELEKLRGKHQIIDLIFEQRELSKLLSTYIEALPRLCDKQGRIHTHFNQIITATGRLSSSDPNLQNIPIRTDLGREVRKAFVAEKGYKLVSADYSQIELRIAASLSGDQKMIAAFKAGEDIHRKTAAEIFKVNPKDVTEKMRYIAKTINFGVIYGMAAPSLAISVGISFQEAQNFIDQYFVNFPRLAEYIQQTKELAKAMGYVETLFGRRRYLPEIISGVAPMRREAERMAINAPVQGSAADIIKMAMLKIHTRIAHEYGTNDSRIRILLQVHDELLFEVDQNVVKEVVSVIKSEMEGVYSLKVPLVVEIKVGDNWGEVKYI